jgi:hypothetical protein
MSARTITIPLNERACTLALGPYRADSSSLRPESRAAIERAPKSGLSIAVRDVTCTVDEARDMLDYFRNGADALTTVGNADAPTYADAFDNVRRALQVAGVIR